MKLLLTLLLLFGLLGIFAQSTADVKHVCSSSCRSRETIPKDSLVHYFKIKNFEHSSDSEFVNGIPSSWFKLRQTDLGLVIWERDNKPFNLNFISNDTLYKNDYFEHYHFVVDSTKSSSTEYDIYCHDTIAWGDLIVHFSFKSTDSKQDIYLMKTNLYRLENDTLISMNSQMYGYYIPCFKDKQYFELQEPIECYKSAFRFSEINLEIIPKLFTKD